MGTTATRPDPKTRRKLQRIGKRLDILLRKYRETGAAIDALMDEYREIATGGRNE